MGKTLVLELPDELERQLEEQAAEQDMPLEDLLLQWLSRLASSRGQIKADPIAPLIGTLTTDKSDIAERHDDYLGAALLQELGRVE